MRIPVAVLACLTLGLALIPVDAPSPASVLHADDGDRALKKLSTKDQQRLCAIHWLAPHASLYDQPLADARTSPILHTPHM